MPFVDPFWFNADSPVDEETELMNLEKDYQSWLDEIATRDSDIPGLNDEYEVDDEESEDGEPEEEDDESDTNGEDDDEGEEIDIQ